MFNIRNAAILATLTACAQAQTTAVPVALTTDSAPASSKEDARETEAKEIGNYVLTQMKIVNARMSSIRKQVIARQIVTTTMDIFESQEHRKQFVTLIAIESKFNPKAKSHAGAVGIGQVMPQYSKEFAAKCGINDLDTDDLEIAEVNLTVSACRFRELLEIFKGQVSLALVAYNAGANSNQVKQLQELRNLSTVETSSYLSKFMYLKEKTVMEQTKEDEQPK
jgi:hypothetical protein